MNVVNIFYVLISAAVEGRTASCVHFLLHVDRQSELARTDTRNVVAAIDGTAVEEAGEEAWLTSSIIDRKSVV